MGRLIGILLVLWLVIGAFAAFQRGYFDDAETNCSEASDIALNVVAGPLNYTGSTPRWTAPTSTSTPRSPRSRAQRPALRGWFFAVRSLPRR